MKSLLQLTEEIINNPTVVSTKQLLDYIYQGESLPVKKQFFDINRFKFYANDQNKFDKLWTYICLWQDNEIIGLCKLGKSYEDKDFGNALSIWFFEIDSKFQGQGYARKLADLLFSYCATHKTRLSTSTYTEMGKERISKLFDEMARKYKVHFIDRDEKNENLEKNYSL